jgi:DNA-binding CsgD family transcriptional regulator
MNKIYSIIMSIREKIIEYLEKNRFKTIKEIAKAIQENEPSVRTKIFDIKYGLIAKGQVVKVAHKKRTGFFSLAKDYLDKIEALRFYYSLIKENTDYLMKNEKIVDKILEKSELLDKIEKVVNSAEFS